MFKNLRRNTRKMFREFLVYNHSSLEYRAKVITLIVSANGDICECEKQKIKEIAHGIYKDDQDRAELLIDTINEYHNKIVTKNGLDFEHLIQLVIRESKEVKRFTKKIDMALLRTFSECIDEDDEDEILYKERILEFLQSLKDEYGDKRGVV